MRLRFINHKGEPGLYELSEKAITIGRSPEADIVIKDERASRIHCGVRFLDGKYYIKDLKSKNGTLLNNHRLDMEELNPGDRIQVGSTVISAEDKGAPGPNTALLEVEKEMQAGKGFGTIMRELVSDAEQTEK